MGRKALDILSQRFSKLRDCCFKIILVESADAVIKIALIKELKPVEWTEVENISESKKDDKSQASIQ